ncbi:DUF3857 domain-containing protein [Altererythrobacter sp. ZODW24]|uniref:DUF3857 domain-containing protein n=1 Tax=Altererythrobacter sp. ZODW24 TaxID=2185142 RepID=UPI000DF81B5E|nr:DUF3857 domain-containing protein [Altererythrobacter sp. ZODW24]
MYRVFLAGVATCALMSSPAMAGEEVLYDETPAWVDVATVEASTDDQTDAYQLFERQSRIEKGQLWVYSDQAIALTSPQALTQFGTLTAQWLPDKGDLIVHRVDLIRGDEVIDVLATGAKFEVLRREQQLEMRMLNGLLTASMSLPGAQLGDTVRLAYSMTRSDQALGDEVEHTDFLPTKPVPLQSGRVVISWPDGLDVNFGLTREKTELTPELRDGYRYLTLDLPREEPEDMPYDAPSRYNLPTLVKASTFADYTEISKVMAPHYSTESSIVQGDPVSAEVAKIVAKTSDPLERAALATQVVQDEISYLLNGLDGGNYLPQEVSLTWEKRYGDCKAKTMLLLSMLRAMDIDAEPILVLSRGGNVLPVMVPAPGNFDHILVQATIAGKDYWLDGTSSGTRLSNIADVPRFEYGLLVKPEGAKLAALAERPNEQPDSRAIVTLDQRAGLELPSIYDITIEFNGANGAQWQSVATQTDSDAREQAASSAVSRFLRGHQMIDHTITFDDEAARATITATGITTTRWNEEQGRFKLEPPMVLARNFSFSPDRARAKWREIPVRVNGPSYRDQRLTLLLPNDGGEYSLDGNAELDVTIGGTQLGYSADLTANRLTMSNFSRSYQLEVPADEIGAARREASRLKRTLPVLGAPEEVTRRWDYHGENAKRLEPLKKIYNQLVADADDDDSSALTDRASFRRGVGDYQGALDDIDAALAIEAEPNLYFARAGLRKSLGDMTGALADLELGEQLVGDASTYTTRIDILGRMGRSEAALALALEYADFVEEAHQARMAEADAYGWTADKTTGRDILIEEVDFRPQDGTLLNALCWYSGIWDLVSDDTIETCTQAVENSTSKANVLDSRAMAYFRMNRLPEALADYDAALFISPSLWDTRFMRGVVKQAMGDASGRKDIEDALRMDPGVAENYAAYGIKPKR